MLRLRRNIFVRNFKGMIIRKYGESVVERSIEILEIIFFKRNAFKIFFSGRDEEELN